MKDLNTYQRVISKIYNNCKQLDSSVQIDWDKVERLAELWLERNCTISSDEINAFCNNIMSILEKEIELRLSNVTVEDAIWLTK